jgi:glycosyltransferase involved in cell wall biosynthesis
MPLPCFEPPGSRRRQFDRFAVVIPVYNHGTTIAEVVSKACHHGYPVIVVDDGSSDGTHDQIKGIQDIRVLRHPVNLGKGAALVTGMREAAGFADWAICLDADGQHDPDDMGCLTGALQHGQRPIIIGKRRDMSSAPWTSRFGREFSNFWVWVSSGVRLSDSQSGYRIYPLPEVLHLDIKARRYQYEIEVLARAAWQAIPIIEIPVGVNYRPAGPRISHFRPWRDFFRNTQTFSRLIFRRIFSPRLWRCSIDRS